MFAFYDQAGPDGRTLEQIVKPLGRFATIWFLAGAIMLAQGLSPATPAKEYIRLNGQVVAIENASSFQQTISVSIQPGPGAVLTANQTLQFTAAVNGTANQNVTWSIDPATGAGTISTDGLYTAPATIAAEQTVTVRGTSAADATKSATVLITLNSSGPSDSNLALGIVPTGSDWITDPARATDGITDSEQFAGLPAGVQWLQLDLGQVFAINSVKLWHYFADGRTYHGVVVQLANDPAFTNGVTTVFNNDQTNQTGQGIGTDAEYVETSSGKMISFAPVNARYVRVWSIGSTANIYNHIVEVAVYGSSTGISVALTPGPYTLSANQTQQFTAVVNGSSNQQVTWRVLPEGAGTISTNGLYTAPAAIPVQQTVTVQATSTVDPSKSAIATITLNPVAGTTNLALGLLPSDTNNWVVNADLATDGSTADSEQYAGLDAGVQWLQYDLAGVHSINGIKLWHYFADDRTYHGVIVQLSTTPDFTTGTTTIFNNDQANQAGQGIGTDAEYMETSAGKLISFPGVNARYVRIWSNGSTANTFNHLVELAVYGLP